MGHTFCRRWWWYLKTSCPGWVCWYNFQNPVNWSSIGLNPPASKRGYLLIKHFSQSEGRTCSMSIFCPVDNVCRNDWIGIGSDKLDFAKVRWRSRSALLATRMPSSVVSKQDSPTPAPSPVFRPAKCNLADRLTLQALSLAASTPKYTTELFDLDQRII